jgi:hypothetical protein
MDCYLYILYNNSEADVVAIFNKLLTTSRGNLLISQFISKIKILFKVVFHFLIEEGRGGGGGGGGRRQ